MAATDGASLSLDPQPPNNHCRHVDPPTFDATPPKPAMESTRATAVANSPSVAVIPVAARSNFPSVPTRTLTCRTGRRAWQPSLVRKNWMMPPPARKCATTTTGIMPSTVRHVVEQRRAGRRRRSEPTGFRASKSGGGGKARQLDLEVVLMGLSPQVEAKQLKEEVVVKKMAEVEKINDGFKREVVVVNGWEAK